MISKFIGWAITRDRARTYSFSTPFEKTFEPTYWVKPGGSFTSPNFNNLKVAILDGWSVDEHCLARYDDVTVSILTIVKLFILIFNKKNNRYIELLMSSTIREKGGGEREGGGGRRRERNMYKRFSRTLFFHLKSLTYYSKKK